MLRSIHDIARPEFRQESHPETWVSHQLTAEMGRVVRFIHDAGIVTHRLSEPPPSAVSPRDPHRAAHPKASRSGSTRFATTSAKAAAGADRPARPRWPRGQRPGIPDSKGYLEGLDARPSPGGTPPPPDVGYARMDAGIVTILVSTAISTATVGVALAALMVRLIRGLARNLEKQIDTATRRCPRAAAGTGRPSGSGIRGSVTGCPGSRGSSKDCARPSPGGTPRPTERPAPPGPRPGAVSS